MKKIPILIWSHMTVEDAIGVVPLIKYITTPYRRYLTYVYNLADIILAPSEYTKSLLIGYGITETKIIVQSNGVDTNVFKKIKKNNSKELVIGDVGLTLPRKGVKDFVETAEYFPKNKFVWYGTKFNLHIPAESAALKNLHFAGYIDDINKAFNSLDIFFHPSYEENEGMVVLEAAAVGLPIIVRDIPVYEGWLVHNENCLKGRTNKEFETHIKKLLSNVELRKRLGESALILAKKRSIENNGKKLLNVYNQLRNKTYE